MAYGQMRLEVWFTISGFSDSRDKLRLYFFHRRPLKQHASWQDHARRQLISSNKVSIFPSLDWDERNFGDTRCMKVLMVHVNEVSVDQ